jgi:hypothetical protein
VDTKNKAMKKIFILLLLAIPALMAGQTSFRLGVSLDPVATWLSPKTAKLTRDGMRLGIQGGLVVEYYFQPHYAVVTGLELSVMGGNVIYENAVELLTGQNERVAITPGTSVAFNITYIKIPVAIKLKTNEIGYVSYFAQLGFTPMINTGSWANSTDNLISKDFIGKEINFMAFDYFLGAGIEYSIGGETALTTGLFFHNGLSDVLSNNSYKAAVNNFSIRLGVLF